MNWILLAASLTAVLGLTLLSRLLGLGEESRIVDSEHAMILSEEAHFGFDAVDAVVDRAGYAALLRNAKGDIMLIRSHGGHFVARVLDLPVKGRLNRHMLTLLIREPLFGSVTLDLGENAGPWVSGLRNQGITHSA